MKKNKNLISLESFLDKEIGAKGTKKRGEFESDYDAFKHSVLIQEARQKNGLTQEEVAKLLVNVQSNNK